MGSSARAKTRAFVKILLHIASLYRFVCGVNRESSDAELNTAFRKVWAKCHPDKGGDPEHSRQLNAARDEWKNSKEHAAAPPAAADLFEKGSSEAEAKLKRSRTEAEGATPKRSDATASDATLDEAIRS